MIPKPIAAMHLCEPTHASAANPAGWLFDLYDADPDTGLEMYIAAALKAIRALGAGSLVFWDGEGGQMMRVIDQVLNGQPIANGYEGSPDLLGILNPAFAERLKYMFRRFILAGLEVGGALRPHELNLTSGKLVDSFDCYTTLLRKMSYAREVLGWTIFYIDTNFDHVNGGNLLPASLFARLLAAMPDCTIFPEAEDPSYYAVSPRLRPYLALENGETGTPPRIRAANPQSSSVIEVNAGDIDGNFQKLVQSVRSGDSLITNSWCMHDRIPKVASIYAAAAQLPAPAI